MRGHVERVRRVVRHLDEPLRSGQALFCIRKRVVGVDQVMSHAGVCGVRPEKLLKNSGGLTLTCVFGVVGRGRYNQRQCVKNTSFDVVRVASG